MIPEKKIELDSRNKKEFYCKFFNLAQISTTRHVTRISVRITSWKKQNGAEIHICELTCRYIFISHLILSVIFKESQVTFNREQKKRNIEF